MMVALFATSEIPPPPPREHANRRRGREKDEARARKKEIHELKAMRRSSVIDEEARLKRERFWGNRTRQLVDRWCFAP